MWQPESAYNIRQAKAADADRLWEIFQAVIRTGDTYVFTPDSGREVFHQYWFREDIHTYLLEQNREILGTYILKPNQPGLGNHVANASYMIHPNWQGKGYGRALCLHSLQEARRLGFLAIQFNLVVSTNERAIRLWQSCGFRQIGILPQAFRHQQLGLVDGLIMYQEV